MNDDNTSNTKLSYEELLEQNTQLKNQIKVIQQKPNDTFNKIKLLQSDRVFNLALDMFCIAGFDGYFKYLNPAWERTLGWSIEELLSKPWLDFVHPDDADSTENIKSVIVDGKEVLKFENRYICKDGSIKWLSWTSQPFPKENIMIGAARDITEKMKIENELLLAKEKVEESESQLIYSQKVARIGYYILNMQTGVWTSSEMLDEIFGINKNYIRDVQGWLNLIHPDFQQEMLNYFSVNIQKNHEAFNKSYQITNIKTGLPCWVHGLGTLEIDKNGDLIKMFGTIQDISISKSFEQELIKAKEKAEESDRLKSAFLANMSHEIRTPMNGILGFTSLLQKANLSVENQSKYIEIIQKSSKRLLNTVNDIIEISKIESGQTRIIESKVDIIGHLDTLVTFFIPEAKKKNIDIFTQNYIDKNGLTIITDKNKLDSILSNLIKNAIKYTNEGTIIIGLKVENNQILISFKDTGIGIPKNRQKAIFNRFEQADIEDKQAHEGSGLGLAIVKSYVELLKGKIWVDSETGKGSTFYVSLPYVREEKEKKEQITPLETKSSDFVIKNINALVVEDDEISSMHLSETFSELVKNILTAKNGIEAIDIIKNDAVIDLIMMDIKMPVMDGIEATKKIRKFNKDVVIIAQTAYALDGDKEKAIAAGCNDYISKPINEDNILKLLNKYF